jgi:excisionase family DNA binding protein
VSAAERLRERLGVELADAILDAMHEEMAADAKPQQAREWLAVAEAADYLGLSRRTLERILAAGELRSALVESRRIIRREWLDEYVAAREDVAPTTPPRRHPSRVSGRQPRSSRRTT